MRLGVNVTHTDTWIAREAEKLGYEIALVPEGFRADAVSTLGHLTASTERIRISCIAQIPARTPTMTAMTAAALHRLSHGRFTLGLGISNMFATEVWHGRPFARPLSRTREYLDVVRMALRGDEVRYTGDHFSVPLPGRAGEPLRMERADVPIHLAAVGPRNLELAGAAADGWIAVFASPGQIAEAGPRIAAGLARAGAAAREPFEVLLTAQLAVGRDPEELAGPLRRHPARFMSLGHREQNFYYRRAALMGFEREAAEVQDRYAAGDTAGAAAAVPFGFVDATSLLGPVDRIAGRMKEYAAAGVTTLVLTPEAPDRAGRIAALRRAAEALDLSGAGA
ncbi:LLM class flavin-dependent oxidoreductase [Actinomadura algeriensis]|uniref:F420-dependent oxidoreductase-like protein n=1 Tax=Actinomadura algeriensis TaxID=1679523 RepID=A0ABR9JJ00_9ACTN|nr:LLM class flavin-dependent oxidoreductase [Actinomadura algeriensis]MBE1530503.1 F420-dependent oxidoreductase-like protein [Actinomadura algeriensis]